MDIETYRDLVVWQMAMELVTEVYELTGDFLKRRAVWADYTNQEKRRFSSK